MKNIIISFVLVFFLAIAGCSTFSKSRKIADLESQVVTLQNNLHDERKSKDLLQQNLDQTNAKLAETQAALAEREKALAQQQQTIQKLEAERQEMNNLMEKSQQQQVPQQTP